MTSSRVQCGSSFMHRRCNCLPPNTQKPPTVMADVTRKYEQKANGDVNDRKPAGNFYQYNKLADNYHKKPSSLPVAKNGLTKLPNHSSQPPNGKIRNHVSDAWGDEMLPSEANPMDKTNAWLKTTPIGVSVDDVNDREIGIDDLDILKKTQDQLKQARAIQARQIEIETLKTENAHLLAEIEIQSNHGGGQDDYPDSRRGSRKPREHLYASSVQNGSIRSGKPKKAYSVSEYGGSVRGGRLKQKLHPITSSEEDDGGTVYTRTTCQNGVRYPPLPRNANGEVGILVTWPQEKLSYTYTSKNITYKDLDFPLLVAGELGVILTPTITKKERECRLRLLQMVAYQSRSRTWASVRDFHKQCLNHAQEVGEWNPFDFLNNEASMMSSAVSDKLDKKTLMTIDKTPMSCTCVVQ